jgi:hypothetical protein
MVPISAVAAALASGVTAGTALVVARQAQSVPPRPRQRNERRCMAGLRAGDMQLGRACYALFWK